MSGTAGGDKSETKTCPRCGAEVWNVRWPMHFRSEDCEPDENDEGDVQAELGDWGAGQ
jgi:hypothetical protein